MPRGSSMPPACLGSGGYGGRRRMGRGGQPRSRSVSPKRARSCLGDLPCHQRAWGLVAMGVGGEWAVAASLVAEVFPPNARAHASGIFHATSVLGVWVAALAGLAVGSHWRYAYLISIVPAVLVF